MKNGKGVIKCSVVIFSMVVAGFISSSATTGHIFAGVSNDSNINKRGSAHSITLNQRIQCQATIEKILWNHRTWPAVNKKSKPAFEVSVLEQIIHQKAIDAGRKSNALSKYWNHPITGVMLQEEMNRIARSTRDPALLHELWDSLGNDPQLIAECLVRPLLADRLIRNWYSNDERFHGELRSEEGVPSEEKSFDQWWQEVQNALPYELVDQDYSYRLPAITFAECTEDSWSNISLGTTPQGRMGHSVVWTGSEMIIWGGKNVSELDSGARYNPATDSWIETSTVSAPSKRYFATAVWTGVEMIVWGGGSIGTITGGRYNPVTDSWTPTTTSGAPFGRNAHSAVWTGYEMIIWGGEIENSPLNTGGRYNPITDSWVATSLVNVPAARQRHTAVWTGTEMIIWGCQSSNSGGRYDPLSNTWLPTSTINAPGNRCSHQAVWTGTEMIVWGGYYANVLNDGGKYRPDNDTWSSMNVIDAPEGRRYFTAIWTGVEMIVWGGQGISFSILNNGGRYNPVSDSWIATSLLNAPSNRYFHTAVWTNEEMIIWGGQHSGGYFCTGAKYNPVSNSWVPTAANSAPTGRMDHAEVWTGVEMIIWGGSGGGSLNTGGIYYAMTDSWSATSMINVPKARFEHTAVWTGTEMIIWGGYSYDSSGGRYNPVTNSWEPTSIVNAPEYRVWHTAVWTGIEMIIWGGSISGDTTNTGGRYNPELDSWTPTTLVNAPDGRYDHTVVWTGNKMIIWGGYGESEYNTGGMYDPVLDSWHATSTSGAPYERHGHSAVWTGTEMIVWGGLYVNTGGRYDPADDLWTPTSTAGAPQKRAYHSAIWTGSQMIIWGGYDWTPFQFAYIYLNSGGKYDPLTNQWSPTTLTNAPSARYSHTALWADEAMIIWGGSGGAGSFNSGASYCRPPRAAEHYSHQILDYCATGGPGNGDGIIDPGESIILPLALSNTGNAELSSVRSTLSSPTNGISVTDDYAEWPTIAVGSYETSYPNHFKFIVDPTVSCGTTVQFNLAVQYDYGSNIISFSDTAGLSQKQTSLTDNGQTFCNVCNGYNRPGEAGTVVPLTVNKINGFLIFQWETPPACSAIDYALYKGDLFSLSNSGLFLTSILSCTTYGFTSYSISMTNPAIGSNDYYLVVAKTSFEEGSYGKDSSGTERPPASSPCQAQQNLDPC